MRIHFQYVGSDPIDISVNKTQYRPVRIKPVGSGAVVTFDILRAPLTNLLHPTMVQDLGYDRILLQLIYKQHTFGIVYDINNLRGTIQIA
jgi:hypothetical protein